MLARPVRQPPEGSYWVSGGVRSDTGFPALRMLTPTRSPTSASQAQSVCSLRVGTSDFPPRSWPWHLAQDQAHYSGSRNGS